jgi:hypothetical protein
MRTDMRKLIVILRNFVKLPKNTQRTRQNLPPLAVAKGRCVKDKNLMAKLHVSKV